MPLSDKTTVELLFDKIVESSKSMYELTARIDERVKFLIDHSGELEKRIGLLVEDQRRIIDRVVVLESKNLDKVIAEIKQVQDLHQMTLGKVTEIEKRVSSVEEIGSTVWSKVRLILDVTIKTLVAALVGYILYRLGFSPNIFK